MANNEKNEIYPFYSKVLFFQLFHVQCCHISLHICSCSIEITLYLFADNDCQKVIDPVVCTSLAYANRDHEENQYPDPPLVFSIRTVKRADSLLIEHAPEQDDQLLSKKTSLSRRDPSGRCCCGMLWRQELLWLPDSLLRHILEIVALDERMMHKFETGERQTMRPLHSGIIVQFRPCEIKLGEVRRADLGCLFSPNPDSLTIRVSLLTCCRRCKLAAMSPGGDILTTDRLRETIYRNPPKFIRVCTVRLNGSHCIQQNLTIQSRAVACHCTPTPPGQKIGCCCVMGVTDLYFGTPMATITGAKDMKLARQMLSQAAMTEGNKHSTRSNERSYFPPEVKNPNPPSPSAGNVPFVATYPVDKEGDANQSGALNNRVRMHSRYNQLMDSAVDGPCKARETTNDDEEANHAFIKKLRGKREGEADTLSWFSRKLTIILTKPEFALKMWMARHPMHLKNVCVCVQASRIIKTKNNDIRTVKESAEGHFDDLTITAVDMSVPLFLSPDALQNSLGEKMA